MEKLLQIRRLHEAYEKEEHNRVSKTVQRMHASMRTHERSTKGGTIGRKLLANSHAIGQVEGHQMQTRLAGRRRNQVGTGGVQWQGTCTLQLFAKPLTSLQLQQRADVLDTSKSDFSRFQRLPDVQSRDSGATSVKVVEPEVSIHVPPNSRCEVESGLPGYDGQCLAVPRITVRAATPSTCSESGGSDMSLAQSASKYHEGKRELTRLIQDIEDLAKETEG